jgi:hypothetical protein
MMYFKFLSLQWKTAIRSPMWQKNLALNIVIGFFLLLFGLYLLLLGLFVDKILDDLYPGADKLELFNGILIYYFLFDLVIRFMMQSLPRLTIESFLHLPVRKSTLIHYMEWRTIFDVINLIPLLIFLPVTFTMYVPLAGNSQAFNWLFSLMMLILANNFLAVFLKRLFGSKPLVVALVLCILILLVILDRINILSLSQLSSGIFGWLASHAILLIFPMAWMIFFYWLQYRFLALHLYPDEMQVRKTLEVEQGVRSVYLRSLGITGTIIALEAKLYWRNKRARTILYLMPVFLLYGLLFYPNKIYMSQNAWLMFVGVFMTGGMMLNYANYAFGYESGYFDALLTKNINFVQYIRVKFYIAVILSASCYILTIPYLFFGTKILLINTAMFLYNIGILLFILLYFATFNKKRMDLTRGGAFNYQGIGAMNWLAILPAFVLPILITIPFNIAGYPNTGIAVIGLIGIIGLFFTGIFLKIIANNFYKRKHIMAGSFREK